MPIYEYQCKQCQSRFEIFHRQGDTTKPVCSACGSKKVTRLMSASGFVLKGSGWYKTDYPSDARKKGLESDKSDAKGPAEPAKKDEKGGEPKAEPAAAKKEEKAEKKEAPSDAGKKEGKGEAKKAGPAREKKAE
jgi:putative FmdB family regulatory protein